MKPNVIVQAALTNKTLDPDETHEFQEGDLGYMLWNQATYQPRQEVYVIWDKDPLRIPRKTLWDNVTVAGLQKEIRPGEIQRIFIKFDSNL